MKMHRFAAGAAALAALALSAPALADGFSIGFGFSRGHCGSSWYGGGWYGGVRTYSYSRWSPVIYRDCNPRYVVYTSPRYYRSCWPRPAVVYGGTYAPWSTYLSVGGVFPRIGYKRYVVRDRECRTYRYPTYRYYHGPRTRLYSYVAPRAYRGYGEYRSYDRYRGGRYDGDFRSGDIGRYGRYHAAPRGFGTPRYGDGHRPHSFGRGYRR